MKINKKKLAKTLDKVVDSVAKKGIYVIDKNHDGDYVVLDYLKKKVILDNLPKREIAEKFCKSLNRGNKISYVRKQSIDNLTKQYHRLNNDCIYYKHVIENSGGTHLNKEAIQTRLEYTRIHISHVLEKLRTCW